MFQFIFRSLFHPSGGLLYSMRAHLRSHSLWKSYRIWVRKFCEESVCALKRDQLMIIGSNAGYLLPLDLLNDRFKEIVAYDCDKIALFVLKQRGFKGRTYVGDFVEHVLSYPHSRADFFSDFLNEMGLEPSRSVIFFTHLLSQLPVTEPKAERLEQFYKALNTSIRLGGVPVASVHERFVFQLPKNSKKNERLSQLTGQFPNRMTTDAWMKWVGLTDIEGGHVEEIDLDTLYKEIPDAQSFYSFWQFSRSSIHGAEGSVFLNNRPNL